MMSKEAKIGLLFSLIFIVSIAVILRSVHDGTNSSVGEKNVMSVAIEIPSDNNLSAVAKELSRSRQAKPSGMTLAADRDMPGQSSQSGNVNVVTPSVDTELDSPVVRQVEPTQAEQATTEVATVKEVVRPEVRYVGSLPGAKQEFVKETNPNDKIQKTLYEISESVDFQKNQKVAGQSYPEYDKIREGIQQGQSGTVNETVKEQNSSKVVHVVANGESLTTIAQKYYGKKEGNRLVNIQKIYNANKDILSSINAVKIGQRLTIPQLEIAAGSPAVSGTTKIAQGSALKSVGGNKPAIVDNVDTAAPGTERVYVVKDKDSLWKIAQRELGNGTRYTEIIKLNSKVLKNNDDLSLGMKLVLPAK